VGSFWEEEVLALLLWLSSCKQKRTDLRCLPSLLNVLLQSMSVSLYLIVYLV
jgi:hypothetical protein